MGHHHKKNQKKSQKKHKKESCSSESSSTGTSTSWVENKEKVKKSQWQKRCFKRVHCGKFKKVHESCSHTD